MHWDLIFENLIGAVAPILFIAAVLGVLLASIFYAVYTAVPKKLRSHWAGHHREYFRFALILIPMAGCVFGAATAYYAEWWSHNFDPVYTGTGEPWWTIFGAPGNMIADSYAGDWQADEAWYYRGDIMFWNGTIWAILAFAILAIFRILIRFGNYFDSAPATTKPATIT